jgi:putative transposase
MVTRFGSHSAFNIYYHIVFCPKRRKPVLVGDIAKHAKDIIHETCKKININVENLSVMPDHIHVFVNSHPGISPHSVVKRLKGATSNILRKFYPQLLKLPALWSNSYYIGTIGAVSESIIKTYIENQKGK